MWWPWRRRKAKPVGPKANDPQDNSPKGKGSHPESRRCWICQGSKVERIIYNPASDTRRHVLYCPTCDHITRKKKET